MVTISDKEFKQLSDYIHENYGIYLKEEKQMLVVGRLHSVLQQAGFSSFTEYFNHVVTDRSGEAVITLLNKITTNHTFFMREADHFYYLRDKVLPSLVKSIGDRDMRIWCAACSSGEEAYTLAMVIDDYMGRGKLLWDTKILATDISDKVLNTAKAGIYSNERIAPLPSIWKNCYFEPVDSENSILTDRIRNEVIYRKLNLMDAVFPFKKKFHVIFCRNVMIYFDNETKIKLLDKMYNLLEDGGWLFIGHSESLDREAARFRFVVPAVYKKE